MYFSTVQDVLRHRDDHKFPSHLVTDVSHLSLDSKYHAQILGILHKGQLPSFVLLSLEKTSPVGCCHCLSSFTSSKFLV